MTDPTDLSWLLTGDDARGEPIPRATANDELFAIKSNPTHIEWGEHNAQGRYPSSWHIGYDTKWGSVALCGVGNDGIPTGCRCSPWHPEPGHNGIDCSECYAIAQRLYAEKDTSS